jgi:hypothetical protein
MGQSVFHTGKKTNQRHFSRLAQITKVSPVPSWPTSSLHKGITSTKFQRLVTSSPKVPKKYPLAITSQGRERGQKQILNS